MRMKLLPLPINQTIQSVLRIWRAIRLVLIRMFNGVMLRSILEMGAQVIHFGELPKSYFMDIRVVFFMVKN